MHFNILGKLYDVDRESVVKFAQSTHPEAHDGRHKYFVRIDDRRYPIKQLIAGVTGLSNAEFTAQYAYRILTKLGFIIEEFWPAQPRPHFKSVPVQVPSRSGMPDNKDVRRFAVTLEQDEDDFYVISCPELPGCHSQGRTRGEALNNITEAIRGYLASMQKHGDSLPQTDWEVVEVAL